MHDNDDGTQSGFSNSSRMHRWFMSQRQTEVASRDPYNHTAYVHVPATPNAMLYDPLAIAGLRWKGKTGLKWMVRTIKRKVAPQTHRACIVGSCHRDRRKARRGADPTTQHKYTYLDYPMQCFGLLWLALVCEKRGDTDKNEWYSEGMRSAPQTHCACIIDSSHRDRQRPRRGRDTTAQHKHTYRDHPMQCWTLCRQMLVCEGKGGRDTNE